MQISFLGRWLNRLKKPVLKPTAREGFEMPGNAESQARLGDRFADGQGATQDFRRAAECYGQAANQGHAGAQFHLGLLLGRGAGVLRDEGQASLWLHRAADQGHAGAQYHLGIRHHRASRSGRPEEASECRIEAFKWLALAVGQNFVGAESARDSVTLNMTWDEVAEGGRRATTTTSARTI